MSKAHLSKVQERRITEEDLLFDGTEPACSSVAHLGSSDLVRYARVLAIIAAVPSVALFVALWCLNRRCRVQERTAEAEITSVVFAWW